MGLFRGGEFRLSSGKTSRWKIDCDALSGDEIDLLAGLVLEVVGGFATVEGVPRGGLRLAEAMRRHASPPPPGTPPRHLIVDDVLTTGGSLRRAYLAAPAGPVVGAVIFARGECPPWVYPLFQAHSALWGGP